ncbi:restriction endonuclease subunit S [Lyngbya aestuarii]|uniref:restriction endonuclease subunit S n=1 Tax=Lyngbya aestuarii TaxID=118322 RepID=UPI00403E04F4
MQLTIDNKQLPVGWKIKKLVEVTDLITCGVAKRPNYVDKGIPFLSAKNVKNGQVIWEKYKYISEETHRELTKNNKPSKGDILYTRVGSFGEAAIIDDDNEFSIFVSLTLIKTKAEIINSFLKHYLNSHSVKILAKNSISGSGVGNLNVGTVRNFLVPLPPLPEQKRIVAILDEAFEGIDRAIANTEKNLANSRELFESYLNAIFTQKGDGWKKKTLQEISIKFTRGKSKHRPRGDKKLYGGKYPLIQTGDISNAKHRITTYSQTYNELGLAQSEIWPQGTVCIAIVGANVAETAILDFDACFPDSVIGIVVNEEVADSDYVEYLLQSFKTELKEKGKGTARDNINLGTFANERFPFPDVKTQKIIACQLKELSFETQRLETIYRRKLAALNELKQSILQKAFTGELTADTPKTAKQEIAA